MHENRVGSFATVVSLLLALGACGGNSDSPSASPAIEPTAHTRRIPLDGQSNFRDLGGYRTEDGRTVKWGEVYRSGRLPDLTDEDVARLGDLKLRTVVSFLAPEEIERYGADRLPGGARETRLPIKGERVETLALQAGDAIRTGDFSSLTPEMNTEIHRLLLDEGREEYAAVLRSLADPSNRPLVYHCSQGVHRTGTVTAILLSALGVPWETIRADYLLSNEYRADEIEASLDGIRHKVAEDRGIAPEAVDMTNVDAFYNLQGGYVDGVLEQAVEEYGSMESYIRDGLGITDEEVERLREELLTP
jgi:protein-tyrosine phosphatase